MSDAKAQQAAAGLSDSGGSPVSQREPQVMPAGPGRPTWDMYRAMAGSPHVTPARRQATLWALEQLEQHMGQDWPERYWEAAGHVPEEVNLGGSHVAALGSLLDLALRLRLLAGTPGLASVQKEMRTDLRDDRRRHAALQLEVGGLARRCGAAVALENRVTAAAPPSDVLIRYGATALRVETFAVILDQNSRESRAYWDQMTAAIMRISAQFGVDVAGDLGGRLGEEDAAELLALIEEAARLACETGRQVPLAFRGADLRVLLRGGGPSELRGGIESGRGWPRVEGRLLQKAAQAARAGGGWLRTDLMDGTWQFTEWARAALHEKTAEIGKLLKPALARVDGVAGIVISSGACFAQGAFRGLSTRTPDRCYGFVRPLPGHRVRETMIIPVTPAGRIEADIWAELYGSEDTWLGWGLSQAGLPACLDIFGQ
ncbi:hypothetical protein EAS64_02415 [Trebonia kvetii]|uniref:Uncharacterized protein n=1 Tax=Trebonia kvetii TaxID=2480626 RepID=A0A6P2C741_9ACTN|nr:hypothetical protein [Trebonia kvetii]TVZ06305.1 hypothetical protein EAS64_02415 [Trebonia kvetii]